MKKMYLMLLVIHVPTILTDSHTIYAHGIMGAPTQMNRFIDAINTSGKHALAFPDAMPETQWNMKSFIESFNPWMHGYTTPFDKIINREKMCMGQGADIATLQEQVTKLPQNDQIILYGCSRGAAAIINYMAEHNPANVQALVLDACPADIPATFASVLTQYGIKSDDALTIFTKIFPAYPKHSITPFEAIKNIKNKELPILLLHSQKDSLVSCHNSFMLYQEFKRQGFSQIHMIMLPEGEHSFLLQNQIARPLYLEAVDSFYKKYGLPHNEK